jgi:acyl-CoA synthetase (AMP-forming)/AMP-acid ligase II/thioesterase domain-containing protein
MSSGIALADRPQGLSIHGLLGEWAERTPDAPAITAPDRPPLTYGRLYAHVEDVVRRLNALGIGRNDRVGVVLANGPEMAVAFLSVAIAATCAPLNPAYGASEFDSYLSDLKAKAVIIPSGVASPVRAVAEARNISILELAPSAEAEAGLFTLTVDRMCLGSVQAGPAGPEEIALVLHTSGTTSRPKIVPLTHANLCTSARNIAASLSLTPEDRCLNVMPLFHIHGLIGAVLSSLTAGASVVCTPGFSASMFFQWVETFRPTWYTAVPTIHQAVLAQAPAHGEIIARCPFRFLRSCSSALPPQLMAELEKVFGAPVIEAYGMTEASHQMAINPLPPATRKPCSVGRASGPEIAIMDAVGRLLPPGESGEVVIRGPSVVAGYENNPEANQASFTAGWFRTGDQGFLDAEGYLFLTGRIKELINRGGEKISPREVEEVLLDHPAVAQAVAFAVPHPTLGEDIAAAVVLRGQASNTERELQEFVAARLADFKVPRRLLILPEIPKGPTGKPQRIGLAQKLGLTAADGQPPSGRPPYQAPRTRTEEALAKIWTELLRLERVGVHDDFFHLGGDSFRAAALCEKIRQTFGQNVSPGSLIGRATIEHLGRLLDGQVEVPTSLVELQRGGAQPPFFCVHGIGGEILSYRDLARHMGPEQPFYGLRVGSWGEGESVVRIEDMAARYLAEVRALQPEGPYFLGGFSFGGLIAFEMAQQLRAQGQEVALLAILDARMPAAGRFQGWWHPVSPLRILANSYYWVKDELLQTSVGQLWGRTGRKLRVAARRVSSLLVRPELHSRGKDIVDRVFDASIIPEWYRKMLAAHYEAAEKYVPKVYPGRLTLIRARTQPLSRVPTHDLGWGKLAGGGLEVTVIPGNHETVLTEPCVRELAGRLRDHIQKAQALYRRAEPAGVQTSSEPQLSPSDRGETPKLVNRG